MTADELELKIKMNAKVGEIYKIISTHYNRPWSSITIITSIDKNIEHPDRSYLHLEDIIILNDPSNACKDEIWNTFASMSELKFEYIGTKETHPEFFL